MQSQREAVDVTLCQFCGTPVSASASQCPKCSAPLDTTASGPPAGPLPVLPGYTVLAPLGWGGSSVVYRARQETLNRDVAIKLIRRELDDSRAWHRFQREAKIIASLSGQQHVVTIYDIGITEAGQPFLVTELLDRGSLSDVLAREGPLDAPRAVAVGRAVAAALSAAHERGILHRDLKPANVLIGSRGQIKLADFGTARLIGGNSHTTTQSVAFTPDHAAPEVLQGDDESPASDVYGLGSTILTALIGRSPFARRPEERIEAMMWRKLSVSPVVPDTIPRPLADLLTQCLAIDPLSRPSLAEVSEELSRMAAAGTIAGHRPNGAAGAMPVSARVENPPTPGLPASRVPTASLAAPDPTAAGVLSGASVELEPSSAPQPIVQRPATRVGEPQRADRAVTTWLAVAAVVALILAGGVWLLQSAGRDTSNSVSTSAVVTDAVVQTTANSGPVIPVSSVAPDPAVTAAASTPETAADPTEQPPATAAPSTAAPSTAAPSTAAPSTSPPSTSPPPTFPAPSTAAPSPAPPVVVAPAGTNSQPVGEDETIAFVSEYYDQLQAGDLGVTWEKLSQGFRDERNLTFDSYTRYWRNTSIEIANLRFVPGPGSDYGRVLMDARYTTNTGIVTNETDEITLQRTSDGGLVITDQRVA